MDSADFIDRRREVRRLVPEGAILLMGNDHASRNYVDNLYPFRQDSHFLYYVGIDHPGFAAVLLPDGREILYGPEEHPDDLVWFGPHPLLADHAQAAGFMETSFRGTLRSELEALRRAGERVHYLPAYRAQRTLHLAEILGNRVERVEEEVSPELVRAVVAMRSVKSEAEIAEIEEALSITAEAYAAVMAAAGPGRTEGEMVSVLTAPAIARSRQQSFQPIVSVRGEVLHNETYGNTLDDGDLLLVDSGAESRGFYASDITRTIPVSGRFSDQQRTIYEIVLAAQMASIEAAAPGVTNRHVHMVAARTVAEGLVEAGLMRGSIDDAVAAGAHALFFPHGIGHMLGLDVHDMEDLGDIVGYEPGEERSSQFGLGFLRLARALEPGFVITIEPGIYFIPALIDMWQSEGRHGEFINYDALEAFRGLGGIRIEDDVLITGDGSRVLGPGIPKTVDDVESACAG
jgi:Xaa-Pro aminopeptidase